MIFVGFLLYQYSYKVDAFEANYENWVNLIHSDDRENAIETANKYLETKPDYYENEFRLKTLNGDYRWIHARARVVERDEQGNAIYMIGNHEDISVRKLAEERLRESRNELRESEERYRILFKSSSDAKFLIDFSSANIMDVNEKATDLYGYSYDELISMKATDLSAEPQKTKAVLEDGKETIVPIRYHRNKDGKVFPVEITTSYFTLNDKKVNFSAVRDISEIKKYELRLLQAQKMESIGNLAGGIAHDFNNVLSSIIGFTELALDDSEKGTAQEDNLQEVYLAGKRAKELVWQILTFAREADEPTKPIQVYTIAKEVLKFIRSSIPTTIEIKQNFDSESLIIGNPTQIHQIIMNLCTNAAHAMDESGGILEVSLKDVAIEKTSSMYKEGLKPGDYIVIKVSDTGSGIPTDVMGSIFEPYFTTKAPGEGTGMGLAVVNGIVEKSGVKIRVESQLGEATVFSVYLPITKKRQAQHVYQQEDLPSGNERILFVDDEAPIAKMGSRNLERLGYSVTTRTSSVEALELFRSKPNDFDLIITDMTMPNITGDELAIELMQIRPDLPVILCTGYSKKISDETASEIGIKAFAYKPIVKADLAKTVRKVLDAARSEV